MATLRNFEVMLSEKFNLVEGTVLVGSMNTVYYIIL